MICFKCFKPYLFIDDKNYNFLKCLRCGYECPFEMPSYSDYHEKLYTSRNYKRDIDSDPQMKFIIRNLNLTKDDFIVDLGCGVGDYTKEIYKISRNVIGIDLSVIAAKNKNKNISFKEHDCGKVFEYPSNYFDKIISINLVEHLIDYDLFLRECKRILKEGGKIAITTPDLDFFLHDYFFDKTHLHEWSISDFKNILEKYFKIEIIQKSSSMFNYYPLNLIAVNFIKPDLLFIGKK